MLAQRAPAPCLRFTSNRQPHEPGTGARARRAGDPAHRTRRKGKSRPRAQAGGALSATTPLRASRVSGSVSGLRYLVYDEAPDRIVGDRRIALRARPRVVNPSIRPPSIETPRSKPRGPRTGGYANVASWGLHRADCGLPLRDPISRVTYERAARSTHITRITSVLETSNDPPQPDEPRPY